MYSSYGRRSQPTAEDVAGLERIVARRAEIETVGAIYGPDAELKEFLLKLLDDMEEALCRLGCRTRVVRHGWKVLADFESFGRNGQEPNPPRRS